MNVSAAYSITTVSMSSMILSFIVTVTCTYRPTNIILFSILNYITYKSIYISLQLMQIEVRFLKK